MIVHSHRVVTTQLLLRSLVQTIDDSRTSATHLREADKFLATIESKLLWYDKLLHRIECSLDDPDVVDAAIGQIGALVVKIITYIKGLTEGTTDRIPFIFASLLKRELRSITGNNHDIALFPLPEFNYLYLDVAEDIFNEAFRGLDDFINSDIRTLLRRKEQDVDNPPTIPSSLILIGFQHAMANDVLFNAILFHELGHHIYKIKESNKPCYTTELESEIHDQFVHEIDPYKNASADEQKSFRMLALVPIQSWINELYSDVYAAAVAGPQFGFAISDLFRLTQNFTKPISFSVSHPAPLLREWQQYLILKDLGWFDPPTDTSNHEYIFYSLARNSFSHLKPKESLVNINDWDIGKLHKYGPKVSRILIGTLLRHMETIRENVLCQVKDAPERCIEFWGLGHLVADLLNHATVPSTVLTINPIQTIKPARAWSNIQLRGGIQSSTYMYYPRPSTVTNVARVIYESGCKELIDNWTMGNMSDMQSHEIRLRVHRRISQWCNKSIADWLLLVHRD